MSGHRCRGRRGRPGRRQLGHGRRSEPRQGAQQRAAASSSAEAQCTLSLIHISEPTRLALI
eukprot:15168528-Alexandrium_andersonii.AAC.1